MQCVPSRSFATFSNPTLSSSPIALPYGVAMKVLGLLALEKETGKALGLKDLFPNYPEGVFAHWFSGRIRLPQGAQLKYIHMGYASIYEYDLFMEFSRGVVTKQYAIHNKLPEVNVDDIEIPAFMKKGK